MPYDPYAWTQPDAIALRRYLGENPKFFRELTSRQPKIEGDTMEARAMTGSDAKGFIDAVKAINQMTRDPLAMQEEAGFIPEEIKSELS